MTFSLKRKAQDRTELELRAQMDLVSGRDRGSFDPKGVSESTQHGDRTHSRCFGNVGSSGCVCGENVCMLA